MTRPLTTALILLLASIAPASAADYRVDVLIYADRQPAAGEAGELPLQPALPNLQRAYELDDAQGLREAGISLLPQDQFGLQKQWNHLLNSKRFEPIHKLSWIQRNPPTDGGPSLHLRIGPSYQINDAPLYFGDLPGQRQAELIHELDGTLRLTLSRYLHLHADLAWTSTGDYGDLGSYYLKESRRMRSGELHHLDSPRFGLLVRVSKAGN